MLSFLDKPFFSNSFKAIIVAIRVPDFLTAVPKSGSNSSYEISFAKLRICAFALSCCVFYPRAGDRLLGYCVCSLIMGFLLQDFD